MTLVIQEINSRALVGQLNIVDGDHALKVALALTKMGGCDVTVTPTPEPIDYDSFWEPELFSKKT